MSDTELPDWVKALVNTEKDKAYWQGWEEGRQNLWEVWKRRIAGWDPRGY